MIALESLTVEVEREEVLAINNSCTPTVRAIVEMVNRLSYERALELSQWVYRKGNTDLKIRDTDDTLLELEVLFTAAVIRARCIGKKPLVFHDLQENPAARRWLEEDMESRINLYRLAVAGTLAPLLDKVIDL